MVRSSFCTSHSESITQIYPSSVEVAVLRGLILILEIM